MMRLEEQHSSLAGERAQLATELVGLKAQLEQAADEGDAAHAELVAQVAAIVQVAEVRARQRPGCQLRQNGLRCTSSFRGADSLPAGAEHTAAAGAQGCEGRVYSPPSSLACSS